MNEAITQNCPCGSNIAFQRCCGPLLNATTEAKTPLALMRSRYTAYVLDDMEYIAKTMTGKALEDFLASKSRTQPNKTNWQQLEIIAAPSVAPNATVGTVEFKAYFKQNNQNSIMHERSTFEKIDGKWYYTSGIQNPSCQNLIKKTGRNETCPCGSGKKYKHCCQKASR